MIDVASSFPSWRAYRLVLTGLTLAAWLILVLWAATPYASLMDHHEIEGATFPALVRWSAFLVGWTLMVVAMMLPGSLSMIKSFFRSVPASNRAPGRSIGSFMLGYLVIWVAFGAAIYLGDTLLHGAVDGGLVTDAVADRIPAILLLAAAVYQFTPLRQNCQTKPSTQEAAVGAEGTPALLRGLNAGLLCLGTSGAVMLTMFALGGGINLVWMASLTALTLIERATLVGRYTARPLGVILFVWAALTLVG